MGSDALAGTNDFSGSAQLGFVHDADRLHQPVAQHVGGFVFGEYEELFQRDVQVLGDQFQRINAWVPISYTKFCVTAILVGDTSIGSITKHPQGFRHAPLLLSVEMSTVRG